jgi:hypothetical protein
MLEDETIWLPLIYAKNEHKNIPAHILKAIKGIHAHDRNRTAKT